MSLREELKIRTYSPGKAISAENGARLLTEQGKLFLLEDPAFIKGLTITEYTFTRSRMGMPSLEAKLKCKECLDDRWTGREYVTLMGENYYIRSTPSSKKSNTDERYEHSLKFSSEREVLAGVLFFDVVSVDSGNDYKPRTNATDVNFYGNIKEFIGRLNCALHYAGIGDSAIESASASDFVDCSFAPKGDGYCAVLASDCEYDVEKTKELKFEDEYIWDTLAKAYEEYEIPFAFHGRTIVFGETESVVDQKFEYGHDNELLSIEKNNKENLIINEITAKGSTENIPYYYPNETEYGNIQVMCGEDNTVLNDSNLDVVKLSTLVSKTRAMTPIVYHCERPEQPPMEQKVTLWSTTGNHCGQPYIRAYGEGEYGPLPIFDPEPDEETGYEKRVAFSFCFENTGKERWRTVQMRFAVWSSTLPQSQVIPTLQNIVVDKCYSPYIGRICEIEGSGNTWRVFCPVGFVVVEGHFDLAPVMDMIKIGNVSLLPDYDSWWECGDKRFYRSGEFGVLPTVDLGESADGDSFMWKATERLPFLTNLTIPKFIKTAGAQRFYRALNLVTGEYADAYKYDDDHRYVFRHPYVPGYPVQYIHTNEDIKPEMANISNFGEILDVAFDINDNDSLKSGEKDSDSADYEHSFFYIKLNQMQHVEGDDDYSLDLFRMASQTDPMTIQMTSGRCAGCKFKIQAVETTDKNGLQLWKNPVQVDDEGNIVSGDYTDKINKGNIQPQQQNTATDDVWIAVQKDVETFGVIMPNAENNYRPSAGDRFNIINIDLPQCYLRAAEKRLERDMMAYMAKNNDELWQFSISLSRIFMAEHPELLDTLDENAIINITYNGYEWRQYVSSITLDYKDSEPLPDIKVDLADEISAEKSFAERTAMSAAALIDKTADKVYTTDGKVLPFGQPVSETEEEVTEETPVQTQQNEMMLSGIGESTNYTVSGLDVDTWKTIMVWKMKGGTSDTSTVTITAEGDNVTIGTSANLPSEDNSPRSITLTESGMYMMVGRGFPGFTYWCISKIN